VSENTKTLTHSPAPWNVVRSDPAEGADVWWIVGNCGGHNSETEIGSVQGGHGNHHEANARLIAAAPDLLSALRWFIDDIDGLHTPMVGFDKNVEAARAAIARASSEASR